MGLLSLDARAILPFHQALAASNDSAAKQSPNAVMDTIIVKIPIFDFLLFGKPDSPFSPFPCCAGENVLWFDDDT